jgi:hypothetical protein
VWVGEAIASSVRSAGGRVPSPALEIAGLR